MKRTQTYMPDMETIKRYWGSMEAYLEEQRRTALVSMEEMEEPNQGWNWDFRGLNRVARNFDPAKSQNTKGSFHLFGNRS